jgi:hypothetical protein
VTRRSIIFQSLSTVDRSAWTDRSIPFPQTSAPKRMFSSSSKNDKQDTTSQEDVYQLEKETWAEKYCPKWMVPYIQLARLNRPAGKCNQRLMMRLNC